MPKIMLVEDDNNLREIYGARLQAEGHTIVSAKDGEEALALAVKEKPDLIISDVMMPKISGFDMLDILRNAPETKNTKVIMMTALSQAEDRARADKLGADMYLVKSQVTLEDVAKAVDKVLTGEPQTNEQPTSEPATRPASEAPPSAPEAAPQPTEAPQQTSGVAPEVAEPQTSMATTPPTDLETKEAVSTPPSQMAPSEASSSNTFSPGGQVSGPPAEQQNASVDQPATEAPVVSSPKKIEVTEHSEPVSEEPQTPKSTEEEASASSAQPPPLEVILPTPPDEAGGNKSTANTAPIEEPVKPSEEPAASEADIGPSLAQILSEESQTDDSDSESDNIQASATKAGAAPKPEANTAAAEPQTGKPAENKPTGTDVPKPLDETPQKKIIQPINDLTAKPDINELLAKEEAKEAEQQNRQPVKPAPQVDANKSQAQDTTDINNPPKQPPDDLSKITL